MILLVDSMKVSIQQKTAQIFPPKVLFLETQPNLELFKKVKPIKQNPTVCLCAAAPNELVIMVNTYNHFIK